MNLSVQNMSAREQQRESDIIFIGCYQLLKENFMFSNGLLNVRPLEETPEARIFDFAPDGRLLTPASNQTTPKIRHRSN